jgi:hypothetical protein
MATAANRRKPNTKEDGMYRTVVIAVLTLAALAGLGLGWGWIEVDAGCCCNPRVCASYIKGSGSPVGLITGEGFPPQIQEETACPTVFATSGGYGGYGLGGEEPPLVILQAPVPVSLRIVGDEGTNCGLGVDDNEFCSVDVAVQCGATVHKKETTPGPLTVDSFNFSQVNGGSGPDSANFTFQLSPAAKLELCPLGDFVDFFVREGFFEACVGGTCVQEFCKADMSGGTRVMHCKAV